MAARASCSMRLREVLLDEESKTQAGASPNSVALCEQEKSVIVCQNVLRPA